MYCLEDVGKTPGGGIIRSFLEISHNDDGTLKAGGGSPSLSQVLAVGSDAGAQRITDLGAPSQAADAATKAYVDAAPAHSLQAVLAVGANANAVTITNAGSPSAQTDVATKGYVDAITFNSQSGTTYTLTLTDQGKCVICSNAAAITLTIPRNATVAFPVGAAIVVRQGGAGQVTIQGDGVSTVANPYSSFATYGQNAEVKLVKIATDSWGLNGEVA
ncbi:MAG TPA: hypothetical protein VFH56_08760 [Acidimicrobiales bacterium]|nr:hypothetical protein [Acidimicrobiales bacterium]